MDVLLFSIFTFAFGVVTTLILTVTNRRLAAESDKKLVRDNNRMLADIQELNHDLDAAKYELSRYRKRNDYRDRLLETRDALVDHIARFGEPGPALVKIGNRNFTYTNPVNALKHLEALINSFEIKELTK